MPIAASDFYTELGQRLGPFSPLVNLGSVGAWSLREMGYAAASPLAVSDTDLASVIDDDLNQLFDIATYQAAERIYDNLDAVQLRQAGIDDSVDDLRKTWRMRVDNLLNKIKNKYNYGLPTLGSGVIDMDFAQREDDPDASGVW